MLYLPAQRVFEIQSLELRLPIAARDLVALCGLFPEMNEFEANVMRLFRRSPSLLLYAAIHFRNQHSESTVALDVLVGWVQKHMFDAAIESDAFSGAQMTNGHLSCISKWQLKPTRKRLAMYLASVSERPFSECRTFVKQLFVMPFDFDGVVEDGGDAVNYLEKLPVRSMWLMCAKLQRLERDFELELESRKMAAMKQLAYGASHEINNPLANIATRAQTLMVGESRPGRLQKLAVIYAQAMRAHEMISDMMLFAHPPEINIDSVDVGEVIELIGSELRRKLRESRIKFGVRAYPDIRHCEMDRNQFAVALKAMIENSIEAIGSDGEIRVQIWENGDRLCVAVVDDGPGVGAEIENKLFDPYYSGREAGRGLGFGLSKAWRIADLHGGSLELDSSNEGGARLVMRLPIKHPLNQKKHSRIDNVRAA